MKQYVLFPKLCKKKNFIIESRKKKIGFVFPIYSWGPPKLILDFIKLIQLEIKYNNYVFFVCTCGDDIGLSKNVFVKALSAKGIVCNSGFSVIMPNNYILMKFSSFDRQKIKRSYTQNGTDKFMDK